MMEEYVNFYSDDFRLEGVLSYCEDEATICNPQENLQSAIPNPQSVLLCSPHPGLGGDMDNNVILTLAEELTKNRFITLRFNYRGVGKSESRFTDIAKKFEYWENSMGTDDYLDFVADTRSAINFLENEIQFNSDQFYYIVGYSFGSIQAMRVGLSNKDIKGIVCISTPFGKYDMKFAEKSDKPKLFINSDNDFAASKEDIEHGFRRFYEPKSLEIITDCDHFYRGKEGLITEKVIHYLLNC